MKTYKFKLYNHKRNKHLHRQIDIASNIYNHCIALHKRYYRRFEKHLPANHLKKHITKLKKLEKYAHWNSLGSQAIQDVAERIDKGYKLFFRNLKAKVRTAAPTFRKRRKYKSFTLKQAGYKFLEGNYIRINKHVYRYFKSREVEGNVKTLTIKRDTIGDIYIYIVTDATTELKSPRTGKSVGFDFGLKTFLRASDGNDIVSPLFFKQNRAKIHRYSKALSSKERGSNNRHKARSNLARKHKEIANQRSDFHWKLAHKITDDYDYLFFEDLNLKGMQRLWGRKINDLGFYSFLQIVKYYCEQKNKVVHFIDRWYPSSKTCSSCEAVNKELKLQECSWTCQECNTIHNRDFNASLNILRVGSSTLGLESLSPTKLATFV